MLTLFTTLHLQTSNLLPRRSPRPLPPPSTLDPHNLRTRTRTLTSSRLFGTPVGSSSYHLHTSTFSPFGNGFVKIGPCEACFTLLTLFASREISFSKVAPCFFLHKLLVEILIWLQLFIHLFFFYAFFHSVSSKAVSCLVLRTQFCAPVRG